MEGTTVEDWLHSCSDLKNEYIDIQMTNFHIKGISLFLFPPFRMHISCPHNPVSSASFQVCPVLQGILPPGDSHHFLSSCIDWAFLWTSHPDALA
jgi:hypothetical protein